jgi:O-antigen/teichoic acid export membrane protein
MLRNLAKDTSIYGGGDFVAKMLAFVSFPMIAAALSPREFGALELLGTITALLGIFFELWFEQCRTTFLLGKGCN